MRTIEVGDKTAETIESKCEEYDLEVSGVIHDLVDDYLDELIDKYGIKPKPKEKEIEPSFTEEYLNTLGMSMRDF